MYLRKEISFNFRGSHGLLIGIIATLIALINPLFSQSTEKDSLLLAYAKSDTHINSDENISLLNELAKKYRFINPDSLRHFAKQLILLGERNKDISVIALGKLREGNYYSDIGNNKKALEKYYEAEELSKEIHKPELIIDLYTQLTIEYYFTRQLDKMLESAYRGIELSQKKGLLGTEAELRHVLGFIYTQNRLYDEADTELLKAISLWKKVNDYQSLHESRSNLARNSILSGDIKKAEKYFSGNLEFFRKSKDVLWLARSYMVQSHIYREKNQLLLAIASNRKYDSLLQKLENPRDKIMTYNLYSRLHLLSGNYDKAKQYVDSTICFSLQIGDSVELLNGYESLWKMAIKKDDFVEAAKFSSLALPIKEVLDKRFREENLKLLRTKHELEYQKLEKELAGRKSLIKQRRITAVLVLFLMVSLGLLFMGRRIVRKRKKINTELQELNLTKNKLFSIIGHDLKSPIGTLQELLELHSSDAISPKDIKKSLPRLKQNVDHSSFTLNNLLYWAKTQMSGIAPVVRKVSVKKKVGAVYDAYSSQIKEKNLDVECTIDPNLNFVIDPMHFEIILRNIISNAIKFTPQKGKIELKSNKRNGLVELSICDSGVGMKKETIEALFLSKYINSRTGTNNEKGTGLGLQITKELITVNHGDLKIESEIGKGSCFHISFPLVHS